MASDKFCRIFFLVDLIGHYALREFARTIACFTALEILCLDSKRLVVDERKWHSQSEFLFALTFDAGLRHRLDNDNKNKNK